MILAIIYSHQPELTITVEPMLCHVYHVNRWSTCPVLDRYFDSVISRTVVLPREGVNGFTRASREYELFYVAETDPTWCGVIFRKIEHSSGIFRSVSSKDSNVHYPVVRR